MAIKISSRKSEVHSRLKGCGREIQSLVKHQLAAHTRPTTPHRIAQVDNSPAGAVTGASLHCGSCSQVMQMARAAPPVVKGRESMPGMETDAETPQASNYPDTKEPTHGQPVRHE